MDFLFGGITSGIAILTIFCFIVVMRVRQFSRKLRELTKIHGTCIPHTIFLMDFYRGSEELRDRLDLARDFYKETKQVEPRSVKILNVIGKLHGETQPIAFSNRDELVARGVPQEDIVAYLGKKEKGAADTFTEVELACEWLWQEGLCSAYTISNLPQLADAVYCAVFRGILLHPIITKPHFLWQRPDYLIGRFFMRLLVFFDPYGINPFSALMRFRRRHINNSL
ncbi:MAG: hypothetical protein HY001_00005 [Candidatus Portnoybacteria bacterium]|nr:hypothetical protein [Candidatus Portnoybacteria bacterium]